MIAVLTHTIGVVGFRLVATFANILTVFFCNGLTLERQFFLHTLLSISYPLTGFFWVVEVVEGRVLGTDRHTRGVNVVFLLNLRRAVQEKVII
jgi:hypothetical protein